MTIPADSTSDDSAGGAKGTALAALPETTSLDFFMPKAEEPAAPRGLRAKMLDYSAHAAMFVGLVGFAWTVGDHVVRRSTATDAPAKVAAVSIPQAANDPLTELRSRNDALADSVRSLQARLDALQTGLGDRDKVAAQVRVLQTGLDAVRSNLGTARSEQAASVARLDGKIDKLGHEPGSRMQQLVDRLGKLERSSVDPAPTASLPRPDAKAADRPAEPKLVESGSSARPVPRPADLKVDHATEKGVDAKLAGADDPAKPQIIAGWVVRDVYQGVALIEGRRGTLEVVPGVSIPGAGVVKSIDRHGSGWTITTSKGVVAYAAPPREYRRADRNAYYPGDGYRYDF